MNMNETFQNEEMARRILQNQRTILEQNAKILAFQEGLEKRNENTAGRKKAVPAVVKVLYMILKNVLCNNTCHSVCEIELKQFS